jgi:hypothetical protein
VVITVVKHATGSGTMIFVSVFILNSLQGDNINTIKE